MKSPKFSKQIFISQGFLLNSSENDFRIFRKIENNSKLEKNPFYVGVGMIIAFGCAARWLHLTPSGKVRERSPAEARTHASRVEEQNSMGEQWEQ